MEKRQPIDVEAELTDAVSAIGGVHVRTIVGDNPPFENADFIFPAVSIIAEVKALDEDRILEETVVKKATALYLEELKSDPTMPIVFGTVSFTTAGRSSSFARRIGALYEQPIKRVVEKANRQIRETASYLGVSDPKGLVVVANNNHSALDPFHAREVLANILRRQTFSSINSVVYMSAGQKVGLPHLDQPVDIFMELNRPNVSPLPREFLAGLRRVWFERLAKHRGTDQFQEYAVDEQVLHRLENKNDS